MLRLLLITAVCSFATQASADVRVRTANGIIEVPLEQYLRGVLPSEMPASWPVEALKAQAVAARSYVLKKMELRAKLDYDVEDSVLDQVYNPQIYESLSAVLRAQIDRAVDTTAGTYITYENGRVIEAFFHADCGGVTETAEAVWGEPGLSAVVKDGYCEINENNNWQVNLTRAEINSMFKIYFGLRNNLRWVSLEISNLSASGRAQNLIAHFTDEALRPGANGNLMVPRYTITTQNFRELFGYSRVKSTFMNLQPTAEGLTVRGKGRGHGVGLCQTGARFMAQDGQSYLAILNHYYPQAKVQMRTTSLLAFFE